MLLNVVSFLDTFYHTACKRIDVCRILLVNFRYLVRSIIGGRSAWNWSGIYYRMDRIPCADSDYTSQRFEQRYARWLRARSLTFLLYNHNPLLTGYLIPVGKNKRKNIKNRVDTDKQRHHIEVLKE